MALLSIILDSNFTVCQNEDNDYEDRNTIYNQHSCCSDPRALGYIAGWQSHFVFERNLH